MVKMLKELLSHSYIASDARVVVYTTVSESLRWRRELTEAGLKEDERDLSLAYKKVNSLSSYYFCRQL